MPSSSTTIYNPRLCPCTQCFCTQEVPNFSSGLLCSFCNNGLHTVTDPANWNEVIIWDYSGSEEGDTAQLCMGCGKDIEENEKVIKNHYHYKNNWHYELWHPDCWTM